MTNTETLDVERAAPPAEAVRFRHSARTLLIVRIAAGVLALPFVLMLVTRTGGIAGFGSMLLAGAAGAVALHAQRRVAARPDAVMIDSTGLSVVRGTRTQQLRWADIRIIDHDRLYRTLTFGTTLEPRALTIDDDIEDFPQFLALVARHIDASRALATAKRSRAHGVFDRPAYEDIVTLSASLTGVVLGLLVGPAYFVITAIALPRLVWHWMMTPTGVVVDDTAVWVVRPILRKIIPLRAIRGVSFRTAGRFPAVAVVIDRRDVDEVVVRGMHTSMLPLFDAIHGAIARARELARTGAATVSSAPLRSARTSRIGTMQIAIGVGAFVAVAWITILTGVPLRMAAASGYTLIGRAVLLLGAPVNAADGDGLTALHHAAARNDTGLLAALLARDADVRATSSPDAHTPLHLAARNGHAAAARLLIDAGADVNAANTHGRTPLMLAAAAPAPDDIVRLLLDSGADATIADNAGAGALHFAAGAGHVDVVRALARARVDIEAADTMGRRALHEAVHRGNRDVVKVLLDAGADVNARGRSGQTPLTWLAGRNGADVMLAGLLMDAGARADIADDDGWNAAQRATAANNLELLQVFARHRLRLDATDGTIPPAIWIAADKGLTDAGRILLRGGASPYVTWKGTSAINLARQKRNATLLALMQMR